MPQIWCAAGVNLTGGRTRDGGSVVGASVFYSGECAVPGSPTAEGDEVEQLSRQLKVNRGELLPRPSGSTSNCGLVVFVAYVVVLLFFVTVI